MYSGGMVDLVIQLIKTWQVIAVTVAIVLYVFLINYVARSYHRPRSVSKSKPKKVKTPKEKKKPAGGNDGDGLDLEEQ
jgi:hypothetical protein